MGSSRLGLSGLPISCYDYFFRFGKFSAIISSNTFPILFSLSSPSGIPIMHILAYSILSHAAAAAMSLQLCPTLCDPMDGSPPGSPVPGILQARTLEWVAISFSNAGKRKVKVKSLSHIWLLVTPWTAAHEAPPSMGFSRQEYWSGVPLPSPYYPIGLLYCFTF